VKTHAKGGASLGFTLVEIMIVVTIIGMIAAIALPSFSKARMRSRASTEMTDLRTLESAFQMYAADNGDFPPPNWLPGVVPPGMNSYLHGNIWTEPAPAGGRYAWMQHAAPNGPQRYVISIMGADQSVMALVDKGMDDGQPGTGKMQSMAPSYVLILEQ
jgi:type II secretion system protein G